MPRSKEEAHAHYLLHREEILERNRRWQERNPERWAAYITAWRARTVERRRQQARAAYQKNKTKRRVQIAAWRAANPGKLNDYGKRWRWSHPEKIREFAAHRRAKKAGSTSQDRRLIAKYVKSFRSKRRVRCYYCGKPIIGRMAQLEHVIPLDRQGPHSISNSAVSCQHCNDSKHNKMISEWKKDGQQILPF